VCRGYRQRLAAAERKVYTLLTCPPHYPCRNCEQRLAAAVHRGMRALLTCPPRAPCRDYEQRLAAAERKVYALTKERDALKRGSNKLHSMDDLIKEKDAIIKQVD
jgi:hypothetical protein